MFWLILLTLLVGYSVQHVVGLLRYRRLARISGLPYTWFPISEHNLAYLMLFETRLFTYLVNQCLPLWISDYINASSFKSRWAVKNRMCKQYGGVYMYATPVGLTCNVSDASVISQVFKARRSFPKPIHHYAGLELFGPNIVITENQQWFHHRRYSASTFNEKNNALVWKEAIRLTTEMIDRWRQKNVPSALQDDFVVADAREDILKLTLNILCSAGFGVKLLFQGSDEATITNTTGLFQDATTPPPGYHFTFRSAMEYMNHRLSYVFVANGLLPKWIPRALLPFFKSEFWIYDDLKSYLQALITTAEQDESPTHNLLGEMVRSRSEPADMQSTPTDSSNASGLSDPEIQGNMFIFTVAGHETTATTLRFALVLLALYPDTQDELYQDIQNSVRHQPLDPRDWDYSTLFPKLVTPLCVMLETLRLYSPVVTIPKWTADSEAHITFNAQAFTVPPYTTVNLNSNGLHYAEVYWGPDVMAFCPSRWDKRNPDSFLAKNSDIEGLSGPGLEHSNIHKPARGAFIPFSDGNRACMGKKFAQVEFVAALTVIFRDYRVSLEKITAHETEEAMHERARQALENSSTVITLAMRNGVPLRFTRRNVGEESR